MKCRLIAIAAVGLTVGFAVAAADPAVAAPRKKKIVRCVDRPQTFTWGGVFFNPAPQPNGCAPPVYAYGRYVGQDPDPFIRQQLLRDPQSGYTQF